jgi:hypothetical protein
MGTWIGATMLVAVVAVTTLGCAQGPSVSAAAIEEKTYAVTPASVVVKAGALTGELMDMKVTERVEKGSERVVSAAKLTGTLKLKNTSANQSVRLVAGKILYIDGQGRAIKLEETRSEPLVKFTAYNNERLDPGQDASQAVDVEFPAAALKAKALKEIRLELAYIPSPFQEQVVNLSVSIGEGK